MSDGTTRDVTSQAVWGSNSVDLVVVAPGLVSAQRPGTVSLRASFSTLSSTREVILVPDGTYRLSGIVSDPVSPGGPIELAWVEVMNGPARGMRSGTTSTGQYVLHGVAGDIELRVTKEGYQSRVERVLVTDHQTLNVELAILGQRPDVSGAYTLTIAAADTCSTALPADALSRTYSAVIKQVGPALTIDLSGATFAKINGWTANVIHGTVEQTSLGLTLGTLGCYGYYYGCGPSLLEQVAPSSFFLPTGSARLAISPRVLAGELDGAIEVHTGPGQGQFSRAASCRSSRHQFRFSR